MGNVCVALCLTAALVCLPDYFWNWASFFYTFVTLLAAIGLLLCWRLYDAFSNNISATHYVLSLSSDGIIRVINDGMQKLQPTLSKALRYAHADGTAMKIHESSQLFAWGLCINVMRQKRQWFESNHSHLGWILKGECSEADYRRLARAIILARKATHSRN